LRNNHRTFDIVGVWSRPIFCGGWKESGSMDTLAFNIQSPSLFIDMRFPVSRDSFLNTCGVTSTSTRLIPQCLQECSDEELIILSRQHCFSGYSYPEIFGRAKELELGLGLNNRSTTSTSGSRSRSVSMDLLDEENYYKYGPVYTRHHIIDWNFHPSFPRPRPNQWWVELSEDKQSFKEHCVARNPDTNLPVYFERWQRYPGNNINSKYLVLRKILPCPLHQHATDSNSDERDSVLIIVGNWFGYVRNRRSDPFPSFPGAAGPGGPALVDYAIQQSKLTSAAKPNNSSGNNNGEFNTKEQWRSVAEEYLDIIGCYGEVNSTTSSSGSGDFVITKCTHPWLEGTKLVDGIDVRISMGSNPQYTHLISPITHFSWKNSDWKVLECSFDEYELKMIFGSSCIIRDNQRSRL